MPAVFGGSSPLSNPDIDWNPSTGSMSNRGLPNNYKNNQRHNNGSGWGGNGNGSHKVRKAWGVEDNVSGGTWGEPGGTSGFATGTRQPFRDPFSAPQHRQQQSHNHSSRPHSAGRAERLQHHPHMNSIGNMNGHVNDHHSYSHNTIHGHRHRHNVPDDDIDDVEESEDEPFYLEDQLSPVESNSHSRSHPHSAPTHPQYPPYPLPYPWNMYPPYPASHDIYQQQHMPYGYPPTIPPHSNPTNNAAFFNTGRDVPKQKTKVHRRRSEDDLEFKGNWAGNFNDNDNNNNNGWGYRNDDNDDGEIGPMFQHHHRASSDNYRINQGRQNFMEDDRVESSFRRQRDHDGHRRQASMGIPIDDDENENDLEPDGVQIHENGHISSNGWNPASREQPRGNVGWGEPTDGNLDSPGWETLNRGIADLRLDRQRDHQHPRHESSPPDLVEADPFGAVPREARVWGVPDNPPATHIQSYANERLPYTNGSIHQTTYPIANGHPSNSSRPTRDAYETHRRRAYTDALNTGSWSGSGSGSGSGFSIGTGVASQLKEKAMKWLRGAGIGSVTLHPILRSSSMLNRSVVLAWDIRRIPHPARVGMPIGEAMASFSEPASKPPLQHMHLIVPIPFLTGAFWHLDVYPNMEDSHSRKQFTFGGSPTAFGRPKSQRKKSSDYDQSTFYPYDEYAVIQCADVLSALSRMLHMAATSHDYHALSQDRQKEVYKAFILRSRQIEDPSSGHIHTAHTDISKNTPEINERVDRKYQRGLKRVDFFHGRTKWEGLEPNGVDAWTVKLGNAR